MNILFVCTGNSCRSVMAEGLFRKLCGPKNSHYQVSSAGVSAPEGLGPMEETVRAMRAYGVDVSTHRSRRLTQEIAKNADRIYVMELLHRETILRAFPECQGKVFLLSQFSSDARKREDDVNIPDPIRTSDAFYGEVLAVILDCVQNLLKNLEAKK